MLSMSWPQSGANLVGADAWRFQPSDLQRDWEEDPTRALGYEMV